MKSTGKYAAIVMTVLAFITFAIAILTPPMSGPFCQSDCFQYPFSDIGSRFPRDYYWMIPAILLNLIFVFVMNCLDVLSPNHSFSRPASAFAILSAGVLVTIYYLQLSVIQPSVLAGETDGVAMLSQFNSHGVFIALEEIGYLLMSLSLACLFPIFTGGTWEEKLVRWSAAVNFALGIGSLFFFTYKYGHKREYLFEIAVISYNWLTLILVGIGLTGWFKKQAYLTSKASK